MLKKSKKILSVIISCTMTISMLPRSIVSGEEETSVEKYQYVLFAGGEGDSLKLDTNGFSINGSMHTNGTFVTNAINANVNGEVTAVNGFNSLNNPNLKNKVKSSEKQKTIIIKQKVKDTCFTSNCDISEQALELIDYNININKSFYSDDTILTKGNLNLNTSIGALNNINLQGESLNGSNSKAIYSENDDINFKFSSTNLTGLIYATNEKVTIDATMSRLMA